MVKFVSTPGSAYEVAQGITAEEAAEAGLAIVEYNYATTPPTPIFGRYKDAPDGAPLGITVDKPGDTHVIGGGAVGPAQIDAGGGKGEAFHNPDPFVHQEPGQPSIHADGAEPGKVGDDATVPQEPKKPHRK